MNPTKYLPSPPTKKSWFILAPARPFNLCLALDVLISAERGLIKVRIIECQNIESGCKCTKGQIEMGLKGHFFCNTDFCFMIYPISRHISVEKDYLISPNNNDFRMLNNRSHISKYRSRWLTNSFAH